MTTAALLIDCWEEIVIVPAIIKYLTVNTDIDLVLVASYDSPTNSWLRRYLKSRTSIHVLTIEELVPIIQQYNIDTIMVMGTAWRACVHNRPLGVIALKQLSDVLPFRIAVDPYCVQEYRGHPTVIQQIKQDPQWEPVGDVFIMR